MDKHTLRLQLCMASSRRLEEGALLSLLTFLLCSRLALARVANITTGFQEAVCVDLDSNRPEDSTGFCTHNTPCVASMDRSTKSSLANNSRPVQQPARSGTLH